ncbi:insulinase family protein [Actinobaculum sp. 352]|nr:peptidase M16 [Actinobaculum sp. 313]RTE47986.1 insulinase family protein [Actinobaculum sp. 352]
MPVRRSVLPGGVRVLTKSIPHQHSTSIGLWVGAGSRDEGPGAEGSTHFLEHLLFKGTRRRSAKDIAARTDYLGGGFNAATAKQYTCYYGHVLEEDLPAAMDLLSDMVTAARLDAADMEMERGVILEELAMYNDDASEVAHEAIARMVFGEHPLGRPVGGTRASVSALQHGKLTGHYQENYLPEELVVTAAGAVDHTAVCEMVVNSVRAGGWVLVDGVLPAARRHAGRISYPEPTRQAIQRHVEQAAVVCAMPTIDLFDSRRPALYALNAILGGGTSSRLFQRIREERGLAYSTYSFPASYPEGGMFALYAGCAPENAGVVAEILGECLDDMAAHGVTTEETESAFRRVRADIVFDSERISSHMNRLGHAELIRGTLVSQDEQLRRSEEVTTAQITELARELAASSRSTVIVGPQD